MALLFLGCFFFLVALILDNTLAVQRELIESGLTMSSQPCVVLPLCRVLRSSIGPGNPSPTIRRAEYVVSASRPSVGTGGR